MGTFMVDSDPLPLSIAPPSSQQDLGRSSPWDRAGILRWRGTCRNCNHCHGD